MVKVNSKPQEPLKYSCDFRETIEGREHVPVIRQNALSLNDFASAENCLTEAEGVLLRLYHILEDCDLNAVDRGKVSKQIKKWRGIRRYYKCLFYVGKRMTGNPKDLQRLMNQQVQFLAQNKKMSKESFEQIKDII